MLGRLIGLPLESGAAVFLYVCHSAILATGRVELGNCLASLSLSPILGVIPASPSRRTSQHLSAARAGRIFAAKNHFAGWAVAGLVLHGGSWLVKSQVRDCPLTTPLKTPKRLGTTPNLLGNTPISRPTPRH